MSEYRRFWEWIEEQGVSMRFVRGRDTVDGWYICDGCAQTFSERTEEALREFGRLTELPAEDESK